MPRKLLYEGEKMEYVIFVFRSRSDSVGFSEILSARGVRNALINTPNEAKVGCGLAVKVEKGDYIRVLKIINSLRHMPSYSAFIVKRTVRGREVRRI